MGAGEALLFREPRAGVHLAAALGYAAAAHALGVYLMVRAGASWSQGRGLPAAVAAAGVVAAAHGRIIAAYLVRLNLFLHTARRLDGIEI